MLQVIPISAEELILSYSQISRGDSSWQTGSGYRGSDACTIDEVCGSPAAAELVIRLRRTGAGRL